jgi:hypothetical protein
MTTASLDVLGLQLVGFDVRLHFGDIARHVAHGLAHRHHDVMNRSLLLDGLGVPGCASLESCVTCSCIDAMSP